MERLIKVTFVALAAVVAGTGGLMTAGAGTVQANDGAQELALKRDEDDINGVLASTEDDDDAGDGETSRSASLSRDRSGDVTTADRSRSLDRSRDRTGDRVGALDRSLSRDFSRDRTGDHNTPDVSNSRDASADQTSDGGLDTETNSR